VAAFLFKKYLRQHEARIGVYLYVRILRRNKFGGRKPIKLPLVAKALIICTLVVAWFMAPAISGVRADSGTLTTTTTTLTYTHGPFFVANPSDQVGPPTCTATQLCDDYTLNVNVPSGTDATQQINVKFTYDQSTDPLVDFDLWVYNSAGTVIASNTSGVSPSQVTIPAISGAYTVRADPWMPGGESYHCRHSIQRGW
jgi:hypothetical protein